MEKIDHSISSMNNKIIHRGPDDHGVFHESNNHYSIAMGIRRLAVIDLSTGNQPMNSTDKNVIIVFNGEIYNYKELRHELMLHGELFTTQSDTEVILRLYEKKGIDALQLLDGMFALSIYDRVKGKLFIARDFFGEKPLYWSQNGNQFLWASELKSLVGEFKLKPTISTTGLNLYFRLTYIPAPHTIYDNIYKLEPFHVLEYDIATHLVNIFPVEKEAEPQKISVTFQEAKNSTKSLLTESVQSRMVSDVPVGAFLSGGVDSSIVSLLMSKNSERPIETFSIGFDKKSFDETEKSRIVAKIIGSNHHEFILKPTDMQDYSDKILLNFDEPFADSSALPSYFVSLKTREHVTVALSGDGGDEMYGGYNKYLIGKYNSTLTNFLPETMFASIKDLSAGFLKSATDQRGIKYKISKVLNSVDYGAEYYYNVLSLGFTNQALGRILKDSYFEKNVFEEYKKKTGNRSKSLTDFRNIDRHISLEGDMLVKIDRTSMLTSLECRAPFLNRKIWDFNNTLPEQFLLKGKDKKFLLKETFKDNFPDNFLNLSKKVSASQLVTG